MTKRYLIIAVSLSVLVAGTTAYFLWPKPTQFTGASREDKIAAIVDNISIGQEQKTIAYTDDNTGENFIIKTDNKDYYTMGGDILVDFLVTNVSKTAQDANVVFSLGKDVFVREVKRFDGNSEVITYSVPTATTTSKEIRTLRAAWSEMVFNDFNPSDSPVVRKDTKGTKVDKTFGDNFKVGQTKYYQATMRVPMGIAENEWFIEAIGADYGHIDPNLWTYEQKFDGLNDGGMAGQDSWTYSAGSDHAIVGSVDPYEGTKCLGFGTTSIVVIERDITGVASGSVYVSIKVPADGTAIFRLQTAKGTDGFFYLYFKGGDIWVYDSASYTERIILADFDVDTWYRIGIAFECGAGGWEGLSADTFKVNVNGGAWSSAYACPAGAAAVNTIDLSSNVKQNIYFDFISPNYEEAPPAGAKHRFFQMF